MSVPLNTAAAIEIPVIGMATAEPFPFTPDELESDWIAYDLIDEILWKTLQPGPKLALATTPDGDRNLLIIAEGGTLRVMDRESLNDVGGIDVGFAIGALSADGATVIAAPARLSASESEAEDRPRVTLLQLDGSGAPEVVASFDLELAGEGASTETVLLDDEILHVAEAHEEPTAAANPMRRGPAGIWSRLGLHVVSIADPKHLSLDDRVDSSGEHGVLSLGPNGPILWSSGHRGFDEGLLLPVDALSSETVEADRFLSLREGVLDADGDTDFAWAVQQRRHHPAVLRGIVWDDAGHPRLSSELAFPRVPESSGSVPAAIVPTHIALARKVAFIGVAVGDLRPDIDEMSDELLDVRGRLQLVDISDPARPTWRGRLTIHQPILDLVADDGMAWVRLEDGSIARIDAGDPDHPEVVTGDAYDRFVERRGRLVADPPDRDAERAYARYHTEWHDSGNLKFFIVFPWGWRAEDIMDRVRLGSDLWPGVLIMIRAFEVDTPEYRWAIEEIPHALDVRAQHREDLDAPLDPSSENIHFFEAHDGAEATYRALVMGKNRVFSVTLHSPVSLSEHDAPRIAFETVADSLADFR